jgi:rubrerythrin
MQDRQSALTVIRNAVHNEVSGQRFYSDAARFCIDLWTKEMFASLAAEEELHTRLLLVEYESLSAHGRWIDHETALYRDAGIDITAFTFPEGEPDGELFPAHGSPDQNVDRRMDDLSALALGIGMEKLAIDLYTQAARATDDSAARAAYEFLVVEETRHHEQLRGQWEKLAGRAFETA